jgi:hypothetical protein
MPAWKNLVNLNQTNIAVELNMKRIAPILFLILLLIAGGIAFKIYKNRHTIAAVESNAQNIAADDSSASADELASYKIPAATLPVEELGIELVTYWKKAPSLNDEAFLKVEVRDVATHELVESPAKLSATVWSLSHSYGIVQPAVTPILDKETSKPTGIYNVTGLYFLAPDQWEVRIYLTKADAKEITETIKVDLGTRPPSAMEDPTSPTYIMMKGMGMDHTENHNRAKEIAEGKKKRHRESVGKDGKEEAASEKHEGHN